MKTKGKIEKEREKERWRKSGSKEESLRNQSDLIQNQTVIHPIKDFA